MLSQAMVRSLLTRRCRSLRTVGNRQKLLLETSSTTVALLCMLWRGRREVTTRHRARHPLLGFYARYICQLISCPLRVYLGCFALAGGGEGGSGGGGGGGGDEPRSTAYFNSEAFKGDVITIGVAVAVSLSIRT